MSSSRCDGAACAEAGGEAVLEAVLSFLDEHDTPEMMGATSGESVAMSPSSPSDFGDTNSEFSDEPGVRSPTVTIKKEPLQAKAGGTRRSAVRSDKRQREEIIALREESLALQDRLSELKSQLMENPRPSKKRAGDEDERKTEEQRKLRAMAWQAMTETQLKRREAAEKEQARLRELIDQQKKAFRQLRRFLHRHADKTSDVSAVAPPSLFDDDDDDTANESPSEADETDFAEISRALPAMLLQTGGLFKDERLDSLMTSLRDLKVQNEEHSRMTIEALESRVVPFDVDTTSNAVWQHHLTKAHRRSPSHKETLEIGENSIRRAFRVAMDVDTGLTKARGRMETRRYHENGRVVIVQSSIMDRIDVDSMVVPNFEIRHFQWTVIGPPRNNMLRESGKPMSQVEIFGVHIPNMPDVKMDKEALRAAIKRGCLESVSLQLEFERQSVETILMQRLLHGSQVSSSMLHVPEW